MNAFRSRIIHSSLYPLATLERLLPRKRRLRMRTFLTVLALLLFFGAALFHSLPYAQFLAGVGLIIFAVVLTLSMAEWYFRSLYFHARGIHTTEGKEGLISLGVLSILTSAHRGDYVRALFRSKTGKDLAHRLGLSQSDIHTFLKERGHHPTNLALTDSDASPWYSLEDFVSELIATDEALADFLFSRHITSETAARASGWVARMRERHLDETFWWSEKRLLHTRPIGKDLHLSRTHLLDTYTHHPRYGSSGSFMENDTLSRVVSGLGKTRESNVLLVGSFDAHTLASMLEGAITRRKVPQTLFGKRVIVLDTDLLVSHTGEKHLFETTLRDTLEEARKAGNSIIVVPRFHAFLSSAAILGSDIRSLIDPYLSGIAVPFLALSDTRTYIHELERDTSLMRRFEVVKSATLSDTRLTTFLESDIARLEKNHHVFFTYPALEKAVRASKQYFSGDDAEDKSRDIIAEAATRSTSTRSRLITAKDILALVSEKTGIPAGELSDTERLVLTDLEHHLHKHVVGQEEAISAIAQALRRARANVRDNKKPIGSFLFFGPTGVGKTETAKALARVFFGSEDNLLRLDMSEYREGDALSRLIGTPAGEAGILSTMIRQKPYGVLLLDEFEKTNPHVHDLFLQILDEGQFSDGEGRSVNARNILFIATSNAGSDIIWKATEEGRDISKEHDAFIASLIDEQLFKPEFLNRFSGTILFHPLSPSDTEKIAGLMLNKLARRLEREGVRVSFTPDMTAHVAREGYDRAFGARPMQRYIDQHVEQYIADGLIKGKIARGGSITLSPKDIA